MSTTSLAVNISRTLEGSAAQARAACLARGNAVSQLGIFTDKSGPWTELEITIEEREHSPLICASVAALRNVIEEGLSRAAGGAAGKSKFAKATEQAAWEVVHISELRWNEAAKTLTVRATAPTALVGGLGEGIEFDATYAFGGEPDRNASQALRKFGARPVTFKVVTEAAPIEVKGPIGAVVRDGDDVYLLGDDGVFLAKGGGAPTRVVSKKDAKGATCVASFDGALWIGSSGGLREVRDGAVVSTRKKPEGLPANAVTSLAVVGDELVVGSPAGYAMIDRGGNIAGILSGLAAKKVSNVFGGGGVLWLTTEAAVTRRNKDTSHTSFKKTQGLTEFTQRYGLLPGHRLAAIAEAEAYIIDREATSATPTPMFDVLGGYYPTFWSGEKKSFFAGAESLLVQFDADRPVKAWNFVDGEVACVAATGDVYLLARGELRFVPAARLK